MEDDILFVILSLIAIIVAGVFGAFMGMRVSEAGGGAEEDSVIPIEEVHVEGVKRTLKILDPEMIRQRRWYSQMCENDEEEGG